MDHADETTQEVVNPNPTDLAAVAADTNKEEYSSTVVFSALVNILKTPSLSSSHQPAIGAIMSICNTQGLKILGYLPQVRSSIVSIERLDRFRAYLCRLCRYSFTLSGHLGHRHKSTTCNN